MFNLFIRNLIVVIFISFFIFIIFVYAKYILLANKSSTNVNNNFSITLNV